MGSLTFEDALSEGTPLVRVGETEAWAYAVEDMPTLGIRTELLAGLSSKGGEAFALSYTPTINTFMYAADGELVNGFDLTVPHIRYGSEQHRFEEQMALAGFADDAVPVPGEMGARFVELVFGITFTADLLERPLPALTVQ